MNADSRLDRIEQKIDAQDPKPAEIHVMFGEDRCTCGRCAPLSDQQYKVYWAEEERQGATVIRVEYVDAVSIERGDYVRGSATSD